MINDCDDNNNGDPFVVVQSTTDDRDDEHLVLVDKDHHPHNFNNGIDETGWEMVYTNSNSNNNVEDDDNGRNKNNADTSKNGAFNGIDCGPGLSETFGTMGKAEQVLEVGKEAILFESSGGGGGCLTQFYFTGNFPGYEHTRIRYYVDDDDDESASIDMELFMGHGIGTFNGDNINKNDNDSDKSNKPTTQGGTTGPWLTKWMGKVGRNNGVHNTFRIPFGHHIRVTAERSTSPSTQHLKDDDKPAKCWWYIRGCSKMNVSIGGMQLPTPARLRLTTLENYTAQSLEEFDLCNIACGPGALFLVAIAAQSKSLSFLEACMRAYMNTGSSDNNNNNGDDDDNKTFTENNPLFLSSGLEDYFTSTYYFDNGPYCGDLAGLTHFDKAQNCFSAYRFHDQDPIFFRDGLRLTCRCGETAHGTKEGAPLFSPQPTTYTTYAWYYQW